MALAWSPPTYNYSTCNILYFCQSILYFLEFKVPRGRVSSSNVFFFLSKTRNSFLFFFSFSLFFSFPQIASSPHSQLLQYCTPLDISRNRHVSLLEIQCQYQNRTQKSSDVQLCSTTPGGISSSVFVLFGS